MADLDASRDRVLKTVADGGIVLAHATAVRSVAAWTLTPAPRDPARHVEAAHARARGHLARLGVHDPAREVLAVMTEELFSRLTDAEPAPLAAPRTVGRYTYPPRKALRRVLDHALDHLNQIGQWLAWQRHGIAPTPTDGWVPSTVTLPDDRLPLAPADLDAWLWRIDQAVRLVVQRAVGLGQVELDWLPPGWPLRRVLHHLARSERLYAAALDEALPDADPSRRYDEACRRFHEAMDVVAHGTDDDVVYPSLYGGPAHAGRGRGPGAHHRARAPVRDGALANQRAEGRLEAVAEGATREVGAHVRPAGLSQAARLVGVAEHVREGLGERGRCRRNQQPGGTADDRLRRPAPVDRDDGARGRHGLQRHDPEVLGQRRVDHARRAREQRAALGVRGRAGQ